MLYNSLHIFKRDTSEALPECQLKANINIKVAADEEIVRLIYKFSKYNKGTRFNKYLREKYKCIIAKDLDDNIVGHCWITHGTVFVAEINKRVYLNNDECALIDFYVDSLVRRRGIYKRLCKIAIEESRKDKYKKNVIWCLASNEPSLRTFSFFGFKEVAIYRYLTVFNNIFVINRKKCAIDSVTM